jgi:hypothetical protein
MVLVALVVLTAWPPKLNVVVESVTGGTLIPLNDTV